MNQNEYISLSLELHLFFDRIMKEHSFFLEASFTERDQSLKRMANQFQKTFSEFLENAVRIADGNVSEKLLASGEIVTPRTLEAENKTSSLSGIPINTNITTSEMRLRGGNPGNGVQLVNQIGALNRQALPAIASLIQFKEDILNKVLSCKMYTTNYPLLISHIRNEAKMYYELLMKVENREPFTEHYIQNQQLFWDEIMKEHAEFIRGLLDPTEKELIELADRYAKEYEVILNNPNAKTLTEVSLKETINFRNFKVAGEEGILNCKIKSIIIPLLADHVVREANHFIRLLRGMTRAWDQDTYGM